MSDGVQLALAPLVSSAKECRKLRWRLASDSTRLGMRVYQGLAYVNARSSQSEDVMLSELAKSVEERAKSHHRHALNCGLSLNTVMAFLG
ncbi:hypothetical protein CLCR_05294 [Cladophialophora carrionii]|uniref:Uncharacterized protein n=1 Tax=Cladophialophora carrionii TaxID=86049 RepID=A0A1C1CJY8_9EURO|nr:hypothetical protein CLCR_05294 [Cladophialophora carrionii]